jgi:hypothetical protein
MFKKGQIIAGLISNTIFILVISKLATGSLNPIEIFKGDSILLKIFVGFLLFGFFAGIISLLFIGNLRDKVCPICGLPLMDYIGSHGKPVRCNYCQKWYHSLCFKKDGGSVFEGCKQPHCRSGSSPY